MAVRAVIFDLDGTITEPYLDFDLIREEMGVGRDAGPVLEVMEKMKPAERSRVEEILHYYEERAVAESTLNAGARETLDELRESGIRIGILTRNRRANALAVAEKHNLRFDAVIGRDDGPVKPDAFGVVELCRRFGVRPDETLLVGDYLYDMLCARTAGASAVLLTNNSRAEEFVEYADFTIEKIDQILQIIKEQKLEGRNQNTGEV